jgi:hypothetical protein
MLRQIKEYKEVRGYTYKGMTLALKYFFEIQKNNPKVQSLGIIPYIYDQAKKYWRDIKIKQKQMEKDEQPKEKIIINIFSEENKPIELNDIANL